MRKLLKILVEALFIYLQAVYFTRKRKRLQKKLLNEYNDFKKLTLIEQIARIDELGKKQLKRLEELDEDIKKVK